MPRASSGRHPSRSRSPISLPPRSLAHSRGGAGRSSSTRLYTARPTATPSRWWPSWGAGQEGLNLGVGEMWVKRMWTWVSRAAPAGGNRRGGGGQDGLDLGV